MPGGVLLKNLIEQSSKTNYLVGGPDLQVNHDIFFVCKRLAGTTHDFSFAHAHSTTTTTTTNSFEPAAEDCNGEAFLPCENGMVLEVLAKVYNNNSNNNNNNNESSTSSHPKLIARGSWPLLH
jgi:hypothetical protein